MPSPERRQRGRDPNRQKIPDWAQMERDSDIAWIVENMHVFEPAAQEQFTSQGPGAIVVDTTIQPDPNAGHPMYYVAKEMVEQAGDDDVKRMVGAYDPAREFVLVMLKPHNRVSTYQVQFPSQQEPPSAGAPSAPGSRKP
jgi:hypothetical protein